MATTTPNNTELNVTSIEETLRELVDDVTELSLAWARYGGFWVRTGAKALDTVATALTDIGEHLQRDAEDAAEERPAA